MKRVARIDREESSSSEEPHFKKRKVEEGQKAESAFVFFPRELHKRMFFYSIQEEQRHPLALGQVSKAFYSTISCFIQEILEENHTKDELSAFKTPLVPKFHDSYFAIPTVCYLYAIKRSTDPVCLSYKMMFEYHLNLYINSWVDNKFIFGPINDNSYTLVTTLSTTSFDINNYSSILVLNKCFERYFVRDILWVGVNFERITSMIQFIASRNSQEKHLRIIQSLVFHCYQQCLAKNYCFLYPRILVTLAKEGAIDPNITQNLKNFAIAKLFERSIPIESYLLAMNLLIELLSQNLKLLPEEVKSLKDLAITKLFDPSTQLSHQSCSINLLAELLSQNLSLQRDEIKSLKDFVIIKLVDPSISGEFQIDLLYFLDQLLFQNLELQYEEISSLKNFAIRKLSDRAVSEEQVHSVSLLIKLYSQDLRPQTTEIDSIKDYAITKFSDESCSLQDLQWILILLSLIINPDDLFDIVPLEFLRDKFLEGIHSHLLKNSPQYDCTSTVKKLIHFYELWMTHPDPGVQSLANEIYRVIKSSQECI